jgi:hypothetical protein
VRNEEGDDFCTLNADGGGGVIEEGEEGRGELMPCLGY